ncbi:sulfotransferase family 1, cytosolic sulfotransferase 4 isoform 1-T1 [Synchiropus picturatus]
MDAHFLFRKLNSSPLGLLHNKQACIVDGRATRQRQHHTTMAEITRPQLYDFHGVHMTHYFTDNWDKVQSFQARPDDILLATYPKAGTTWVSHILDLMYFGKSNPENFTSTPVYERVPFLEIIVPGLLNGVDLAENLTTTPRLIKTHLPVQMVPKSFWEQKCRIVYVARNAKDCAVSLFHFGRMNKIQPDPGDWNTYLKDFMDGKQIFGSWYDHSINWWEKKKTYPNLHYVFYEDLVEDCGREVDNFCSFLGVTLTAEEKQRVLGGTQFDNMKKNNLTNYSGIEAMDFKVSPFMRKGKVGDWKNHFTVAQNEQFEEHYKEKLKNCTLKFRTEL